MFLQVETLPYRLEILRWDSLSLRCVPVSEWVIGIRGLFLIMLPNHLPQELQILRLCGLSGLLLHSIFWDKFLMRPTFLILQKSAIRMSPFQTPPAIKAYPEKIPGNTFLPNWWILALSLSEFRRYSTSAPNGMIGPLNDSPNLRPYGVFPSVRRSWTYRR